MKVKLIIALIIFYSFAFSVCLCASPPNVARTLPYPLVEAEDLLIHWFNKRGFSVSKSSLGDLSIKIIALKPEEGWQVILQPYSPLATKAEASYTKGGGPDDETLKGFWADLKEYSKNLATKRDSSDSVFSEDVLVQDFYYVCIKAVTRGGIIEFSGAVIDRGGLVLSTAHDLEGIKDISIKTGNGQFFKGYLLATDFNRDLAVIKADMFFESSVSLARGRNRLYEGEKVYFIGCSEDFRGTIHNGTIINPLRKANNMPLLPVKVDVSRGDSGGPAFDEKGNFIGIVKGRYRGRDPVGFLIPLDIIVDFLKEIKTE